MADENATKSDPRYFVVDSIPETWVKRNGAGTGVVTSDVWNRPNFDIGSEKIIGRGVWGGYHPVWLRSMVYYNTGYQPLEWILHTVVMHHSDNNVSIKHNEQRHVGSGYAALGYHFFIDPKGLIYEGRPIEVMGSHAGEGQQGGVLNDPDWGSIGIVLQGDYHHADDRVYSNKLQEAQLLAAERLIRELKKRYAIRTMALHREVVRAGSPKACPGDQLVPILEKMRVRLELAPPR